MSKYSRWVEEESERWTAQEIISSEQAARIRALYATAPSAVPWGLIVFFGLGAVVLGLGVILVLAYNWSEIPKFGKLTLVFGALILSHGFGLHLRRFVDWRTGLSEALSLVGTMTFGAGIWLVAQIYNIDEHFPTGFLIWAIGALALAWVLESVPQAIVATLLFTIWAGVEALEFGRPMDLSVLILAGGIIPLAWRRRSGVLMIVVLAAMYWLLTCNAMHWGGGAGAFGNAMALSVLLVATTHAVSEGSPVAVMRQVFRFFGWLGFVACAYLLSFHATVESLLRWSDIARAGSPVVLYRWVLFLVAAVTWLWLAGSAARGHRRGIRPYEWLCPIALVYAQLMSLWGSTTDPQFTSIVFNLICLGTATAWMVRGCRRSDLGLTVRGSALLALVVFARYFDLFDSLAARGVVFLVFGAVLFAEGFYYRRVRATGEQKEVA